MNRHEFLERGRDLLDEVACHDVKLGLDNAKVRAGCYHVLTKSITLSRHFVDMNDWETVRETLLHEAAHAFAPHDGHGADWAAACEMLGIPAERCYDGDEVAMPEPPWAILCTGCQRVIAKRHRRVRLEGRYHRPCMGSKPPLRIIRNPEAMAS